ncbi:LysR substrate-binding domain-containing protein [Kiloniella laminariae]|uniref:LysR substrate-binding domain-containing protein n=1 Tax=Kiloniella laminariae TaxID=454162 RepID=A0ABT4LH75_9PROT|nr:LysR substrate-binding domain-containing protein [Kiloniella laminariae]MCZ4280446.1 LysR substrate-binding domain-containing protein [Kiloniella laminariae]
MRMRQLEAFRATILNGTISAAAQKLKTTQPTISRLLADLEYSLKLNLFHRRKGRVVPTPEGMEFYRKLDEVFDAFTKLRTAAEDISRDKEKELRVISLPALSISIVPEILEEFSSNHPDISISLNSSDVVSYFNRIKDDDIDIALGNQMGEQPGVEQITLAKVNYICALPPGHPLAEKEFICAADLEGERMIGLDSDQILSFQQHADLYEAIHAKQQFSTQHSGNAYALVRQGLGISLLEPFSAPIWAAAGVVIRPFYPKLVYRYSAYIQKNRVQVGIINELLEIATRKFKKYGTS